MSPFSTLVKEKATYVKDAFIRKKLIDSVMQERGEKTLAKVLTVPDLLAIGVGSTVGAGIFVLTGQVAKEDAGPAVVISYLASGIACVFSGLCYAEFAARIPVAGSAYLYAYCTLGEFIAWFIAWDLILEYVLAASAVARGWSGYVGALFLGFGVEIPRFLYHIPYNCGPEENPENCAGIDLLAFFVVIFLTIVCSVGTKTSSRFNIAMMVITIAAILFVIIGGAVLSEPENFEDFFPYGLQGAFHGAAKIFFAYVGFDTVSTFAEEVKNPNKDMPIGIMGSIGISTTLYCGVATVVCGMVYYADIDVYAPLAMGFAAHGVAWAQIVVSFGAFFALTTSILASILGMPRIFMAMARDGLIFSIFKEVHPKFGTPFYGTWLTGIAAGLLTLLIDIEILAHLVSIGTLMAFLTVSASVLILRVHNPKKPHIGGQLTLASIITMAFLFVSIIYSWHIATTVIFAVASAVPIIWLMVEVWVRKHVIVLDSFQCPLVPVVPWLGIACNLYLILNLSWETILRWFIWFVVGTLFYLVYGMQHSKLRFVPRDTELLEPSSSNFQEDE